MIRGSYVVSRICCRLDMVLFIVDDSTLVFHDKNKQSAVIRRGTDVQNTTVE